MSTDEPVEIDPNDRPLLEKIGRLRVMAWSTVMPDAGERSPCWLDEFELTARHWCIFHDGEPVASGRMSVHQRIEDVPDAAIHASQVFHFLTPDEVETGLRLAFRWLRPGGRLFILAATPYQATHARFISAFSERKTNGNPWPGVIEDIRGYNTHWSADLVPPWLHVFDEDILAAALRRAGFVVEWGRMFSRTGLPDFCRLDGRENLGIIASKPTA